jgi:ubiquinone/menaquinone biosynthesis C-methylase UbiE
LPLARLVGTEGKVLAVDSQAGMIKRLSRKAKRTGLLGRLEPRLCTSDSLELDDYEAQVDFALAFAVVHEVPDASNLFREILCVLKPAGRLLLAEPRGHVSEADFEATITAAETAGFNSLSHPGIRRSRTVLLEKMVLDPGGSSS